MDIKWSQKSINELIEVVEYLKKNTLGEMLEHFANYFIKKHGKYLKIENYAMDFANDKIDATGIGDGEYKLAFICEIVNSYSYPFHLVHPLAKNKRKIQKRERGQFKNVYSCLEYMIKYGIYNSVRYFSEFHKPTFTGYYLTNLLRDLLIPERKIQKEDPYLTILYFSYFLVTEIMNFESTNQGAIYKLSSLMADAELLNISILSKESNREMHKILKTKRTIFVRFLLILTNEILNIEDILEPKWLLNKIKFSNREEFVSVVTSSLVEVIILLTSNRLSKKLLR